MMMLLVLLRLLLQLRPWLAWLHVLDMTDAVLQTMPAGDPGGINAGICGLSGKLVVLLFA
jgi:hypothetical protein